MSGESMDRRSFGRLVGLGVVAAATAAGAASNAESAPNPKLREQLGPIGTLRELELEVAESTKRFVDRMDAIVKALNPRDHILKLSPEMEEAINSFLEQLAAEAGILPDARNSLMDAGAINWAFMWSNARPSSDPRLPALLFRVWTSFHRQAMGQSGMGGFPFDPEKRDV